jgi:3-oxoacyl-[acyl-carrier-protein] synthase III
MSVANAFIKSGTYKNILVVGAEVHSFGLDFSDEGRGFRLFSEMGQEQLFFLPQKMKMQEIF